MSRIEPRFLGRPANSVPIKQCRYTEKERFFRALFPVEIFLWKSFEKKSSFRAISHVKIVSGTACGGRSLCGSWCLSVLSATSISDWSSGLTRFLRGWQIASPAEDKSEAACGWTSAMDPDRVRQTGKYSYSQLYRNTTCMAKERDVTRKRVHFPSSRVNLQTLFPLRSDRSCLPTYWPSLWNHKGKGKASPLQAWTGPEGSRRLRLQDFKTIGTCRW